MLLKDSAPEKWEYKEHTRVKHELLRKYLSAWIIKLGGFHRKIVFFDGFAGRGEYDDGTLGSPIIALQVANELLENCEERKRKPYFDQFVCVLVEKDSERCLNLKKVMEREKAKVKFAEHLRIVGPIQEEFANVADTIVEEVGEKIAPSFFFIDPFGFSGVPFSTVKNILSLPRTEVFFTFMTRDINRFLDVEDAEQALEELFPIPEWRQIYQNPDWRKRDQLLKDLYLKCLFEIAKVRYVWSFRVCMDEKYQTLYYLIHATNHFDGLKIMKEIMYNQGVHGQFAYLGPKEVGYRNQLMLFQEDVSSLKEYLLTRFKGNTKTFRQVLEETYMYTRFVETHYRGAIKKLEGDKKVKIAGKGPREGINDNTRITFLHNNPGIDLFPASTAQSAKVRIHYKEYQGLNGRKETLIARVNDGSIISRFDKTPLPERLTDVVCPHFLELKWAYGCPFDCSWCYLKGTFRFRPDGLEPVVKDYEKIKSHVEAFLEEVKNPEILNTGEIADSLMHENSASPFSKFIIPMFENQRLHKVLFLTKSSNVKNLLEIYAHDQAIISFSLNAIPVAERWEKAPGVLKRIEAVTKVYEAGYEARIRIDPMVPIDNWKKHYLQLLDNVFESFIPERITFGSLRGLQSTINGCSDKSWVRYLKERSNWGKKIDFETRFTMYSSMVEYLETKKNYAKIALCKETIEMWDRVKMNYRKIKCNCTW